MRISDLRSQRKSVNLRWWRIVECKSETWGPEGAWISNLASRIAIPRCRVATISPASSRSPSTLCDRGNFTREHSWIPANMLFPILTWSPTCPSNTSMAACVLEAVVSQQASSYFSRKIRGQSSTGPKAEVQLSMAWRTLRRISMPEVSVGKAGSSGAPSTTLAVPGRIGGGSRERSGW